MNKKIVSIALILSIFFNLILPNYIYAANPVEELNGTSAEDIGKHVESFKKDGWFDKLIDSNEVSVESKGGKRTEILSLIPSATSTIATILSEVFALVPTIVNAIMNLTVSIFQDEKDGKLESFFTIENLVFNRYTVFKINYFDLNTAKSSSKVSLDTVKENVAIWYFSLRNVAIVANLIILVYIGIRMVISSVADERAKYKKMLFNWVMSFVLLFLMHYVLITVFMFHDITLKTLDEIVDKMEQSQNVDQNGNPIDPQTNPSTNPEEKNGRGFEEQILETTWARLLVLRGWDSAAVVITLYVLVYHEIKFFLMYFRRMLSIGFLLVISPLITITYAIDAVKDGKSQVYQTWFKEMVFNVFIQEIHAVTYAIFIFSAGEIAKEEPIMAAILFMTLTRAVKVVKTTLKLSSDITKSESLMKWFKRSKANS